MGRNCDLELRLVSFSDSLQQQQAQEEKSSRQEEQRQQQQQQQQLTIFYNGKVSVCSVTEAQARAILLHATREMADKLVRNAAAVPAQEIILAGASPDDDQSHRPATAATSTGRLSMKRSLQRFLQKRNQRINNNTASPYNTNGKMFKRSLMC